jgi:IS1 family transposase
LPEVYQQCAVAYTDFWQAYNTVIPHERHHAVGKESGQTNHIERLNNTNRAAGFSAGQRQSLLLQKVEQSHWGNLVLYSWL